MYHFNLLIPDQQMTELRLVAQQAEVPIARLMKQLIQESWNEPTLNRLLPWMSGQIVLCTKSG